MSEMVGSQGRSQRYACWLTQHIPGAHTKKRRGDPREKSPSHVDAHDSTGDGTEMWPLVVSRKNARSRLNWLSPEVTPTPPRRQTHGSRLNRVSIILLTVLVLVYPPLAWPQTAGPNCPIAPAVPARRDRPAKQNIQAASSACLTVLVLNSRGLYIIRGPTGYTMLRPRNLDLRRVLSGPASIIRRHHRTQFTQHGFLAVDRDRQRPCSSKYNSNGRMRLSITCR